MSSDPIINSEQLTVSNPEEQITKEEERIKGESQSENTQETKNDKLSAKQFALFPPLEPP